MADGGGDDGAKTIRRQRARRDDDDLRFAKVPNEVILEAAREVREHFGWSQPTVQKWMTYLIYHGLAGELPQRNHGDFAGSVYLPAELSADEISRWSLRDGEPTRPRAERRSAETRNPETVSEPRLADVDSAEPHCADTYKEPSSLTKDFPSTSNLHSTLRVEGPAGGGDDGRDVSGGVTTWLEELEALAPKRYDLWAPLLKDDESLAACREQLDDALLRTELWGATDARVGRTLLSADGLDGYRRIVVACADIAAVAFTTANDYLLDLIDDRIGWDRRRSLLSWRWLLRTLLDRVREPGDIDEPADEKDDPEIPF